MGAGGVLVQGGRAGGPAARREPRLGPRRVLQVDVEPHGRDRRAGAAPDARPQATVASLMLASGMSMLEVSQQLGHADSSITAKVYAHVLPTEVVRSSERYDARIAAERARAEADAANVTAFRRG